MGLGDDVGRLPDGRGTETVGYGGVDGRPWAGRAAVVVAVLLAYAVGAVAGIPGRREAREPESAFRVYERDGALPAGLALEGWHIERTDPTAAARCVLLQPGQRVNVFDDRLAGAVITGQYPRRVKPDPRGRVPALVTCTDDAGAVVTSFGVRPRAYVSDLSTVPPGAVVSEVPLPQRELDALGELAAAATSLVGETVVYLVRSPPRRFERRADADGVGNLVMPAELVDGTAGAATVLFHGLVRKGLDESAGARQEADFGGDLPREFTALSEAARRTLHVGVYGQAGLDLGQNAADYAASALTVWKYHRVELQRSLRALPADDEAAARGFLRSAIAALVGGDTDRQAALESLAPGTTALLRHL